MPHVGTRVAAIILAAGSSSRMGRPKQLLRLGSRTLLRKSVEEALAAGACAVAVVVGSDAALMHEELGDLPVETIGNPDWLQGIGTSVSAGVQWATIQQPALDAIVLMTCDQPNVTAATIGKLIAAFESTTKPLVASAYGGTIGVPALFSRDHFSALARLPAEKGAKDLLLQHRGDVALVESDAGAIDLDTPADFERFARQPGATS